MYIQIATVFLQVFTLGMATGAGAGLIKNYEGLTSVTVGLIALCAGSSAFVYLCCRRCEYVMVGIHREPISQVQRVGQAVVAVCIIWLLSTTFNEAVTLSAMRLT